MLVDGYEKDYEQAVIISNDSDLITTIEIIQNRLHLKVGVLNPHRNISWALKNVADFYRPIREGVLRANQLPQTLADSNGTITRPTSW